MDSLKKERFTVNTEKCGIGMEEAKYLGYIVGRGSGETSDEQGRGYSGLALPYLKQTGLSPSGHCWVLLPSGCPQLHHYCSIHRHS